MSLYKRLHSGKLPRKKKKYLKKMFSLFYRITRNHKVVPICDNWRIDSKTCGMILKNTVDRHRVVRQDVINDEVFVSTVFLGLNHRHGLNGPPLLFETMVFGGPHDRAMVRYTSYKKALKGHRKAMAWSITPEA